MEAGAVGAHCPDCALVAHDFDGLTDLEVVHVELAHGDAGHVGVVSDVHSVPSLECCHDADARNANILT